MAKKTTKKSSKAGGYITPKKQVQKRLDQADIQNPYSKKKKPSK